PLSITTTAPVATIGQYLSGMPNLTGIAVGATTRPLPTTTVQEQTLIWSAGPSSACEIVDGRIVVLSDSPCTLTGEADGNENYSDFVFEQTFTGVPNTDALEDAIAHALPDETSGDFTSGSWGDYQEALQAAKDLLTRDDPVVTQAEVDAALEALAAAKDALVDLSALRALVNEAVTDESSYTPETWSDYVDALEGAQETLNDARATDDEVAAALEALVEAEEKLVHRADFTELGQVVGLVDALPANGTVDGEFDYDGWDGLGDAYDALQAELGEGRAVFDDKNSTQDEIDAAAGELREALAQVESAMELAEAIVEIDDLNLEESNYTEDSWKVLTDALAAADAALDTTPLPDQETL